MTRLVNPETHRRSDAYRVDAAPRSALRCPNSQVPMRISYLTSLGARPRVLGVAPAVRPPMRGFTDPAATIRAAKRTLAPD